LATIDLASEGEQNRLVKAIPPLATIDLGLHHAPIDRKAPPRYLFSLPAISRSAAGAFRIGCAISGFCSR
jgi:hypothetical protein